MERTPGVYAANFIGGKSQSTEYGERFVLDRITREGRAVTMTHNQFDTLRMLAARRHMSQGELLRAAQDVTQEEVNNLDQLTRSEVDRLICYLDQLEVVGVWPG